MSWRSRIEELAEDLRHRSREFGGRMGWAPHGPVAMLLRPEPIPDATPARRLLEPVGRAVALSALVALIGVALTCLSGAMLAAGAIYLILTHGFGIDLGLGPIPA